MNTNSVTVAYLAKAKYGGWPTFTRHLCAALQSAGCSPMLRTSSKVFESEKRDFGFGLSHRRCPVQDMQPNGRPVIIAAADRDHAEEAAWLVRNGAFIVVHDPAEKHLADMPPERTVVIRRSMKRRLPSARLIVHPYQRKFAHDPQRNWAGQAPLAQSRIDFDKYTHMILEANDLGAGVRIIGAANRMYVHFKLAERWPLFDPEAFPRTADAGAMLCRSASACVDMSAIKNDGGGSQYSFLEAWDAQAPLIINRQWLRGFADDEMQEGRNCLAADSGAEIKAHLDMLQREPSVAQRLTRNGEEDLLQHAPELIGQQYRQLLLN